MSPCFSRHFWSSIEKPVEKKFRKWSILIKKPLTRKKQLLYRNQNSLYVNILIFYYGLLINILWLCLAKKFKTTKKKTAKTAKASGARCWVSYCPKLYPGFIQDNLVQFTAFCNQNKDTKNYRSFLHTFLTFRNHTWLWLKKSQTKSFT